MPINATTDDEQLSTTKKSVTIIRLLRYLLTYKKRIIIVMFIMAYIVTAALINPLIMEAAIDNYIRPGNFQGLVHLVIFAVSVNVVLVICIRVRLYLMADMCNDVLVTIRQELYTHIQTLDFHFFDKRPTGKVLARIIGDINSLREVLANFVTTLIPDFLTVVAVVVIMFVKNPPLAAAALSSFPLLVIGMFLIQHFSHKLWQIFRRKSSNLNAFVHENLSGIRVVQGFAAEDEATADFAQLTEEHRVSFNRAVRVNNLFWSVVDICWFVSLAVMYYVGIMIIGTDKITLGTFIAFGAYVSMFWQPLLNLSNFYNQLLTNIAGAERVFEILDTPAEITDASQVSELPPIVGKVTFSDVSFSYDEGTVVLDNVSFTVEAGETIALVGPTGAGKTTIVNLISRFYDVQQGTVAIDDIDVKTVSIESLRQQMGIMTQDTFLFSGTIRDNIRYGKLDATDEEIIEAAKAVRAHDFIMEMEKGYDYELSGRGGGLSIGQKQLLAFARTMVSKPRILILDEATSSIDTHTELLIQKGIASLLHGRTSFVIAHRLSTIRSADRIFVIDEGHIVEEGNHDELMAMGGLYHGLQKAQMVE
ncbi:MAG: ABC transporter ATP-binding protein/permease [Lachnospiraceae bacterium]|jgi:ATP-binding cassette subfamily B protein|nr:ABC transporter ATP-binding protein/permease [Lachnospiraceae bacterium]